MGRDWEQPEYWEEFWRLEETCCHSNPSEKPSAKTNVKNSQGVNNNNNNNNINNYHYHYYYYKVNLSFSGFCHSNGPLSENKRMRKDRQILGPCQRTKKKKIKQWKIWVMVIPVVFDALGTVLRALERGLETVEDRRPFRI